MVVRRYAAEALVRIGQPSVEPLIAALKDEDVVVRRAAAEALGKIGGELAIEPLVAVLKDEDVDVRRSATEALGKIGDGRVVEPLIVALGGQNVRQAAAAAFTTKESQKREYEIILEREPDNQIALQGLLKVQMEMQDFQGASTTLEKLIALNPEETAYQAMYQSIKRHLNSPVEDSKANLKH
ncbi:hypothetical protein GQR42_08210 [Microcystis aeruginosa FD4]|uniref:HEAT repeat domain-containing protein n=1 Tax=Microcystis aeruginosa FD4 TaxID=2686288 RepID=A0A857D2H0_MICAE|nr:hypothetical protein GQR42_08210 [Microcystis aeruginosa FD4]